MSSAVKMIQEAMGPVKIEIQNIMEVMKNIIRQSDFIVYLTDRFVCSNLELSSKAYGLKNQ